MSRIPSITISPNQSSENAILSDDESVHSSDLASSLPAFKKRPLSDTPFISYQNSPILSTGNDQRVQDEDIPEISDHPNAVAQPSQSAKSVSVESKPTSANVEETGGQAQAQAPSGAETPNSHCNSNCNSNTSQATSPKPFKKRRATTIDVPGLTKSKTSPDGTIASLDIGSKLVIIMVGLPARGKSYITNKLSRYLNWSQHECRVFNVGNTRRQTDVRNLGPSSGPLPDLPSTRGSKVDLTLHSANFFAPESTSNVQLREKWAMDTLDQLIDYIVDGPGSVGIFDATNSTRKRRERIIKKLRERSGNELKILFLESICDDVELIEQNVRLKLQGPDYKDMDPQLALEDFHGRLTNYEKAYETIGEYEEKNYKDVQYVKMINVGKKIISYNIQGFLASQAIYYLLNFNLRERMICITRHGESEDNVTGRIGGDSGLTERGVKFSKALARFIQHKKDEFSAAHESRDSSNFCVWTSMLRRSVQSAAYFSENDFFVKQMRMLDELGAGKMEGMTYTEIQQQFPEEYEQRLKDKLKYRYPGLGGESYLDVINRLKPVITEIERSEDHLLLIAHRVVSRILLGYFLNIDKKHIGDLDIPLHSLYILEPKTYGVDWELYEYSEEKDWFYKVDKFKYTRRLEEVKVSNAHRKYSVVPSVPSGLKSKQSVASGSGAERLARKLERFQIHSHERGGTEHYGEP